MDGARVGVEQQLVRIEAQPDLGTVRTVDAIAIDLTWSQLRNVAVPHVPGAFRQRNALGLVRVIGMCEEADFDGGGMFGEEREIDTRAVPMGAKRERRARPYPRTGPRVVSAR